jgi:hypothetical protein
MSTASALGNLSQLYARAMDTVWNWGTNERDRELSFECDRYVPEPHNMYYRGVDVQAPADVVFRWLCQLRVAPYSHDWIDNFGRRSPRELIPGLERLAPGQRMLTIFKLVEFEPNSEMTLNIGSAPWFWGPVACTYRLVPHDAHSCRLLAKVTTHRRPGIVGKLLRSIKWGELIMMRRQLLNFKQLAEATAREGREFSPAAGAPDDGAAARVPH